MKEQTSAVHYAIALLLGVIGLLIILIFVSLRSQAEFLNTPEGENQEVTQEVPALDQQQETPEVKIEYTDGEGNVIKEGEEGNEEDNTGEASTSTEDVLDLEDLDSTVSTSNENEPEDAEDKK